jgi:death-on-curing protein
VIIWLACETVEAIHEQQLFEHGGLAGIREPGQLVAILNRPRNLQLYEQPDLASLAGCYAYGLATTQIFIEGNKRTSWVAARSFCRLNGYDVRADTAARLETWERLGDKKMSEPEISAWIRARMVKL